MGSFLNLLFDNQLEYTNAFVVLTSILKALCFFIFDFEKARLKVSILGRTSRKIQLQKESRCRGKPEQM